VTYFPSHCCNCFRYGRVNYVLARRIELLQEVSRLEKSMDASGDNAYTCETAGYFYIYQVSHVLNFNRFQLR
jgi:hypothetical protein